MQYDEIQAKSILSKHIESDGWFHTNSSMNLYRGCEHGCVYCDGHCQYYRIDDFYTRIRAKVNAPEVLRKELKRLGYTSRTELETETLWSFLDPEDAKRLSMSKPRKIVIGVCGGVSDGYQPAEEKYQITRKVLEVLLDYQMPIMILTKSDLVLRDLDLLKEIHRVAFANVVFTITTADDETQKILEPKSSTTTERFAALREVRKAGLYGGVMATPIVPFIGDDYDNMIELAKMAKGADAEFIMFAGMTLKPGRQKDYFMSVVKKRFPEVYESMVNAYSNDHKYGMPIREYTPCNIMQRGFEVCRNIGIRYRSVRHPLPGSHEINYRVIGQVLDIEFYEKYLFGKSWKQTKEYHELAVKLEKGVRDLRLMHEEGTLAQELLIGKRLNTTVQQIIETGTCDYFEELDQKLSEHLVTS